MADTDAYFDTAEFDFALFDYPIIPPTPSADVPTVIVVTESELNTSVVTSAEG